MSPAERARRYRARKRARAVSPVRLAGPNGVGNQNRRTHGGYSGDLDEAARDRLPDLPDYLNAPMFAEAVAIARRTVLRAERISVWVAGLSEVEQLTPLKAGSSPPAEVARAHDQAALNALDRLGLTPASAARWGRGLEESGRPDIALQWQAYQEEGGEGA